MVEKIKERGVRRKWNT